MKTTLFAIATILGLSIQSAWAGEKTITLDVHNMTCALCPITVSTAIKTIPGVRSVEVSVEDKSATVVFDDDASNIASIAQASTNAGYPASQRM